MNKAKPKIKYIVREVPPESCDFEFYFEDDGLTEKGGDWNYNLFIICNDGYGRIWGFNTETYKGVMRDADNLIDAFNNVGGRYGYNSFKEAMDSIGVPYNSRKCHALKEWWKSGADASKTEDIATYLTITTGKEWNVGVACGYCQRDYAEIVYCTEHYTEQAIRNYGDVFFGCAKEFCVIDLDENGEETDSCYGFIVADSEAWRDEDYKRLVADWACIDVSETRLEMIDGYKTRCEYSYRVS